MGSLPAWGMQQKKDTLPHKKEPFAPAADRYGFHWEILRFWFLQQPAFRTLTLSSVSYFISALKGHLSKYYSIYTFELQGRRNGARKCHWPHWPPLLSFDSEA
jgi:hypothetical protein